MNWQKEKISSFTAVTTGGTPSTDKREFWDGGKIPWLNSGDLNQGIVTKASNFITEEGYKSSSTKMMPPNTVLIALTGATTGLTALLKIEACANQSVTGIFPSERHHPEFLYYFFRTQRERILKAAWGGAQPHINQKYVKDYTVPIPPLIDQVKIATVLTKVETLINLRKENITDLDSFLTSAFLEMFGDPVRNEKGWETVVLSKLGSLDRGVSKNRPRNAPELLGGKHPLIQTGEVTNSGLYITSYSQTYSELGLKQSKLWKKGTMLITIAANIARTSILTFDACFPDSIVGFIADKNESNTIYVHFLFSFFQSMLERNAPQSAQKNINLAVLRSLVVPKPPLDLQNDFAEIVSVAEKLKQQFKSNLSDLESLYSSLSQKAFEGELDLSKLEINHIIPISGGGNTDISNLEVVPKEENKKFADKLPKEDKRYGDPFEVDEATARKQGAQFYREWKKLHPKSKKSKITWTKVSTQEVANWVKENYSGYHFTSEMLIRFLMEEHVTQPDYYSSEELKKYPQTNEADDLKSFVFSAINKQNPFLQLEQVFYDAEAENLQLNVTEEDFELIKERSPKERSGIYFTIVE